MKVYHWDEVAGEVDTDNVDVPEDSQAYLVKAAWEHMVGADEQGSEYARWIYTDLSSMTLITGRFGRDRQYMLWWGEEADCQKFASLLDPH